MKYQAQQLDEQLIERSKLQNTTFESSDDHWWDDDDSLGQYTCIHAILYLFEAIILLLCLCEWIWLSQHKLTHTTCCAGNSFANLLPVDDQIRQIIILLSDSDPAKQAEVGGGCRGAHLPITSTAGPARTGERLCAGLCHQPTLERSHCSH